MTNSNLGIKSIVSGVKVHTLHTVNLVPSPILHMAPLAPPTLITKHCWVGLPTLIFPLKKSSSVYLQLKMKILE